MMVSFLRKLLFYLPLVTSMLLATVETQVSNTNFTISQGSVFPNSVERYLYNYNRLRLKADYSNGEYFATIIGDGVNYLGADYVQSPSFEYVKLLQADTPITIQSNYYDYDSGSAYVKLYRFYGGYEDSYNRLVIGLQNITMGVGRIWTPTNSFNPRNAYALEPDEVFPVAAVSYTRYFNDTTQMTLVASQKEDFSFKYAARLKSYFEYADFALDFVHSDTTQMIGYEVEGNLANTGIEVRSEGAFIQSQLASGVNATEDVEFFQGIFGADYGFENGVSIAVEGLYSTQTFDYTHILGNVDSEILPNLVFSNFYLGTTLSYAFNLFLEGGLVYIESFNSENSRFVVPTLTYTLNDYNSFTLGAMLQNGSENSEFGMFSNTYYFKYSLSF